MLLLSRTYLDGLQAGESLVLPPIEASEILTALQRNEVGVSAILLDPWYNRHVNRTENDYVIFCLLEQAGKVAPHVFLWGFPDMLSRFARQLPELLRLHSWRSWTFAHPENGRGSDPRSSHYGPRTGKMVCLHLMRPDAVHYPSRFTEHVDFDASETQHFNQKPVEVFEQLFACSTKRGDLVFDPTAGSGTTGAAAQRLGLRALLSDRDPRWTNVMQKRLGENSRKTPEQTPIPFSTRPFFQESFLPPSRTSREK